MFKKILFATTATPACDDAARVAFELAARHGAKLVVYHVLGVPTRAFSPFIKDMRTGEEIAMDDEYKAWVLEELKNTYARQLARCATVEVDCATGYPHREILRKARQEDADLIVMGASTRDTDEPTYRSGIAGSTMQRVAKAARCPVLTVARPAASYWGGFSNIVFGTDFSKPADSAFQFAYKAAKESNSELHLFHSLDISSVSSGVVLSQDEIEDKIIAARDKMRTRYVAKMEDFTNWDIEVWEGVPYVEIVKFARERQADLIVMAHHTREADPDKAMIGSTVEQVILRATCPVVSVNRPDKV
ncbi:MAG: universal stress protein [Desulfovibrionaceae bacterium]